MPLLMQVATQDRPGPLRTVLLNAAAATTTGHWTEVRALRPLSITIEPSDNWDGTVRILVSNNVVAPPDSSISQPELDQDITDTAGLITLDIPFWWVKAIVSEYTAGSVSVFLVAG